MKTATDYRLQEARDGIARGVSYYIVPDAWSWGIGGRLTASDWHEAMYRLQCNNGLVDSVAANITVTGRTVQYSPSQGARVRIKVEFVGDGEPSTYTAAWLYLDSIEELVQG